MVKKVFCLALILLALAPAHRASALPYNAKCIFGDEDGDGNGGAGPAKAASDKECKKVGPFKRNQGCEVNEESFTNQTFAEAKEHNLVNLNCDKVTVSGTISGDNDLDYFSFLDSPRTDGYYKAELTGKYTGAIWYRNPGAPATDQSHEMPWQQFMLIDPNLDPTLRNPLILRPIPISGPPAHYLLIHKLLGEPFGSLHVPQSVDYTFTFKEYGLKPRKKQIVQLTLEPNFDPTLYAPLVSVMPPNTPNVFAHLPADQFLQHIQGKIEANFAAAGYGPDKIEIRSDQPPSQVPHTVAFLGYHITSPPQYPQLSCDHHPAVATSNKLDPYNSFTDGAVVVCGGYLQGQLTTYQHTLSQIHPGEAITAEGTERIIAAVISHELGHTLGLVHTCNIHDIMFGVACLPELTPHLTTFDWYNELIAGAIFTGGPVYVAGNFVGDNNVGRPEQFHTHHLNELNLPPEPNH